MHHVCHQSLTVCYGKTFHTAYTRDLLSLQLRQESHDGIIAVAWSNFHFLYFLKILRSFHYSKKCHVHWTVMKSSNQPLHCPSLRWKYKFSRLKGGGGAMILTKEMTMAIAMITIMKCNAVGARRRCYLFPFLLPLSRKWRHSSSSSLGQNRPSVGLALCWSLIVWIVGP